MTMAQRGLTRPHRLQDAPPGMAWCSFHQKYEPTEGFYTAASRPSGYAADCKEGTRLRRTSYREDKKGAVPVAQPEPAKKNPRTSAPSGMAWCSFHQKYEPTDRFYTSPHLAGGYASDCKEARIERKAGKPGALQQQKEEREADPLSLDAILQRIPTAEENMLAAQRLFFPQVSTHRMLFAGNVGIMSSCIQEIRLSKRSGYVEVITTNLSIVPGSREQPVAHVENERLEFSLEEAADLLRFFGADEALNMKPPVRNAELESQVTTLKARVAALAALVQLDLEQHSIRLGGRLCPCDWCDQARQESRKV